MKRLFISSLALLMALVLTCCSPDENWLEETGIPAPEALSQAEYEAENDSDMGKSLTQINQDMLAGEWRQIVQDKSQFQLGGYMDEEGSAQPEPGHEQIDYGSYPKMDGSTVCVPMAMEFTRQYLDMEGEEELKNMAMFSTTHDAYVNLITKQPAFTARQGEHLLDIMRPVDIILATKPSEEELAMAAEYGVELLVQPICMDAFVFITHEDNPVDNLTTQQIKDIYTGRISNWKEVGGPDMAVTAYQRSPNSGSQTAMESMVMQGEEMQQPQIDLISQDMGDLIEAVKEYENSPGSIGYTYKYYIDNLYDDEGVKVLSVDGVYPDAENVRSLKYPFYDYYNGVIRNNEPDSLGRRFLEWITSVEGQQCVQQAGYIMLPES